MKRPHNIMLTVPILLGITACEPRQVSSVTNNQVIQDRIELQANAVQMVNNDEMQALVFIEKTANNPKTLTQQVNPLIEKALEIGNEVEDVKLSTASQRTTPNYNYKTNTITSWSMRSELRLVSQDFASASELLGRLQDLGLQVSGISFSVSDATRQRIENQLIEQVTNNFKERAKVAQASWGAKDFRLLELSINSNTQEPRQPVYYGDAMYESAAQSTASDSAPLEGGENRISMTAKGAVQLIN